MFDKLQKIIVFACIMALGSLKIAANPSNTAKSTIPTFTDEELISRLGLIDNKVIKPKFTRAVKGYIRTYTVRRREYSEGVVGKTVMYFPMFEKTLEEYRLPTDLKYLAIVESGLNAEAYSRAGAAGLWQFMKGTGKEFDLTVNKTVDERMDPLKSTDAAARYLQKLYERYDDWALALAAYNSGPGRVNRAIRKGRSKNFWVIQRYLPKETRNYVPGFIAATYLMHYYDKHNLAPVYPDYDLQITETTRIYQRLSFDEISGMTGVSYETIKRLNPSFRKDYIPTSSRGYNFTLPYHYMGNLMNNLNRPDSAPRNVYNGGIIFSNSATYETKKIDHEVVLGENLKSIARKYNCADYNIVTWNGLQTPYLVEGQKLLIYQKISIAAAKKASEAKKRIAKRKKIKSLEALPKLGAAKKIEASSAFEKKKATADLRPFKITHYVFKKGDNLMKISRKFDCGTAYDILEFNDIKSIDELKPGRVLKIKQF